MTVRAELAVEPGRVVAWQSRWCVDYVDGPVLGATPTLSIPAETLGSVLEAFRPGRSGGRLRERWGGQQ